MATNITLGESGNTIDLTDTGLHFVLAESFHVNGDGTVSMTVIVRGVDDPDDTVNGYRSIQAELNKAEAAFIELREDDRVELGVQFGTTNIVYYDVRRGRLRPTGRQSPTFELQEFELSLEVENVGGWPVVRAVTDSRSVTGNLSNGHARILVGDVDGDLPAYGRIILTDTSTSGAINRFRISRRSAVDAGTADWSPWIALVPQASVGVADASSFSGTITRINYSSTDWNSIRAYGTVPAGDLNQGSFHVYARVKDTNYYTSAPTSGTAVPFGSYVAPVQGVQNTSGGGGTSITATWGTATTTGHTLLAILKAHKSMTRYSIGTITTGTALTTIQTTEPHNLSSNDRILIEGVDDTEPNINGRWTVDVSDTTTFTIPIGSTVGGASGSIRELFYEEINQVPSGYILIAQAETPEELEPASGTFNDPGFGRDPVTTINADEWDQTKLWIYAKPNGSSESGGKTFGWTGSLSNRAISLIAIQDPEEDTGGLGLRVTAEGSSILDAPSVEPGTVLIGISATQDGSFQPLFGFKEYVDTGEGLVVATKFISESKVQPWGAAPSNYNYSVISALIGVTQELNPATYGLDAGQYQFRVQAVDADGGVGIPTATFSATLNEDGGALQASWSAPTAADIDHYLITVSFDSKFYEIETPDDSTSYVLTSLENLKEVSALPSTTPGTDSTLSGAHIRALIGTNFGSSGTALMTAWDDIALDPDNNGTWHMIKLGTFTLPPQGGMASGTRPTAAIQIQARSGGGRLGTIDIDALNLVPADEPSAILEVSSMDSTTQYKWVFETNRAGRPVAWQESKSGGTIYGRIKAPAPFTFTPGDNILSITAEKADGESVIGSGARFTAQIDIYTRYILQQGV